MDKLIYTVMSAAQRTLHSQQIHANNLANSDTAGFRADFDLINHEKVVGFGYDTRNQSVSRTEVVSSRNASIYETGRSLDLAIVGDGFLAVEFEGEEVYSRAGSLMINENSNLTLNGNLVLGEGGEISLPEFNQISISENGTIIIQTKENGTLAVDKLKLVDSKNIAMNKNNKGFLIPIDGETLETNPNIKVKGGALESSNVQPIEEMTSVMNLNRSFEIQMKMFQTVENMSSIGNRLIRDN